MMTLVPVFLDCLALKMKALVPVFSGLPEPEGDTISSPLGLCDHEDDDTTVQSS